MTPAALEINPLLRSQQFYVIINTVTSLLGSCLSTFAVSAFISNKCATGSVHDQDTGLQLEAYCWLLSLVCSLVYIQCVMLSPS